MRSDVVNKTGIVLFFYCDIHILSNKMRLFFIDEPGKEWHYPELFLIPIDKLMTSQRLIWFTEI